MATHSSIFAWEIPWTEEPDGLWAMGSQQELDMTEATKQQRRHTGMHPALQGCESVTRRMLSCRYAALRTSSLEHW